MKKLLNTLFVTTQGAYLSKEGETVVVKVDGEISLRLPVHTLGGIVCFAQGRGLKLFLHFQTNVDLIKKGLQLGPITEGSNGLMTISLQPKAGPV